MWFSYVLACTNRCLLCLSNNPPPPPPHHAFTWRYIDDLCGFGDRGQSSNQLDYGMAHEDTTDSPYTLQNKSSMTAFLSMKIITNTDGIWISV